MNDEKRLALALDACLKSIASGKTLEEALAPYPDLQAELRPELQATLWLRQRKAAVPFNPVPGRQKLEASLRAQQPNWGRTFSRTQWYNRAALAMSLLLVVFMFVQVASSVNRAAMVSIPGDAFYALKLLNEQAQLASASQNDQKAELYIGFTRQRSSEMISLFFEDRPEYIAETASRLRDSAAAAEALLNAPAMAAAPATPELKRQLQEVMDTHLLTILTLPSSLPTSERAEVEKLFAP